MAPTKIVIGSHNLHSFKKSGSFHKACIHDYGGVWMGQELWLSEKQLTQLHQLETRFVARSGMEEAISSGILRGRPFGGVSISWSKDLNHVMTPLANYRHKRVVAAEMETESEKILFISIYMPFYDSSKRAVCLAETADALSMIELLVDEHPQHQIIIGGDLNTELNGHSPFDNLWNDLVTRKQLAYCSHLFSSPGYTYHHASLGHKKMNDHFIVSQNVLNRGLTTDHQIIDVGENLSDHLPIVMKISAKILPHKQVQNSNVSRPKLNWSKLTDELKDSYTTQLRGMVDALRPRRSHSTCSGRCHCSSELCHVDIQREYDDLNQCVKDADASLPRQKPGTKKEWWNDHLTRLKHQSIEIHDLWKNQGMPQQGDIYRERLRVRAAFRSAIKEAQRASKQESWDRLHSAMEHNETNDFWNSWRNLYSQKNSQFSPVVEGCSSKENIADAFKKSFEGNSVPNKRERVEHLNSTFSVKYREYQIDHEKNCNCDRSKISLENVVEAICALKSDKCGDEEGLNAEHLQYAPLNLLMRITTLFNDMMSHSFVPKQFRLGFMVPIVKDNQGNLSDVSNYRGITISPIWTKVFEHVLKLVFGEHLSTSPYQFGFKKRHSTVHALYCLKTTINYYVDNGSRVFCSFLDASKAFDRLVHSGLFLKLMEKGVPKIFLDIIMTWYDGLQCRVLWDGHYSEWFCITAGVRQGGVLSPIFYSLYVNELISILQSSNVGCHLADKFAAALIYADDMAVLAPSLKGLQKLLSLCENYCREWDIRLNSKKTKNLYFGKGVAPNMKLKLDGDFIDWVSQWKYLGLTLLSGNSFSCTFLETLNKFYRAANSILRVDGRSNDLVMLRLLESHCVPILAYAIEVVHIADSRDRRKLRVAYNSIFRNLFGYTWRQSVTNLQHSLGRSTWEELAEKRKINFSRKSSLLPRESLVRTCIQISPV